jgi:type I restriction enzyme S subunit
VSAWKRYTLSECCEIVSGATPSTSVDAYWDGDVCWATPKDLSDLEGHFISDTPRKLTEAGLASCAATILPPNSVLFSSRAPIGHTAINTVPMATNQGFKSLIPRAGLLDSKFLLHWLRKTRSYLEGLGVGATFKEVSKAIVSKVEIDLPPLPEQRRIAAILDKADALRTKRREALAQLDRLAQSIFVVMFGSGEFGEFTIGQLIENGALLYHKDGNHGSLYPRAEEFGDIGIPFLSAKSIDDYGVIDSSQIEHLNEDKARQLRIGWIEDGDVLLSHNASVGKVASYDGRFGEALIGTSLTAYRPNPKVLNTTFLAESLKGARFQLQLQKNMGQTTRNQVPITAQRDLSLPLPPLELQLQFATTMKSVEHQRALNRQAIGESDQLVASLQHRAFHGEL